MSTSLANAVRELEARRAALEAELEKVNARLKLIGSALGDGDVQETPSASVPRRTVGKTGKKLKVHRWFEQGEALALMRKLIKKPMRPVEVINALAEAKGYAGKLQGMDRNRFNWAVISALKAATDAKQLIKHKDGRVSVPR
ncbi:MAG: hypothetical protein RMK97_00330 [Sutterellaceae bacterium]|nr:hypothetical protein [Burkholderiaceae bacterium]MCX7901160.1 hypothetical protein [Burkholderiaceae bacterium]MDW8428948.1 hypothetical protein [Sutterellaceae bacterium]